MRFDIDPGHGASSPEQSPAKQFSDAIDRVTERGIPMSGHAEMRRTQERTGLVPQLDNQLDPTVYLARAYQPGSRTVGYAYRRKSGALVPAEEVVEDIIQGKGGSSFVLFISVHPDRTMTEAVYSEGGDGKVWSYEHLYETALSPGDVLLGEVEVDTLAAMPLPRRGNLLTTYSREPDLPPNTVGVQLDQERTSGLVAILDTAATMSPPPSTPQAA